MLAGGAAYLLARAQTPSYRATARLVVDAGPAPTVSDLLAAQQLAGTYVVEAQTREFASKVIASLGLTITEDALLEKLRLRSEVASPVMTIDASDEDPLQAALLANGVATAFQQTLGTHVDDSERSDVDRYLASIAAEITGLDDRIAPLRALTDPTDAQRAELSGLEDQQLRLQAAYASLLPYSTATSVGRVRLLEAAVAPDAPTGLSPTLFAILGALAGVLFVTVLIFIKEYADDRVTHIDDLRAIPGLRPLGMITSARRESSVTEMADPASEDAEAYRRIRSAVDVATAARPPRTILLLGVPESSGTGVVAANLAAAFAQVQRRVLLVDADLRSPKLDGLFPGHLDRGLSDLLEDPSLAAADVAVPSGLARLSVLFSGSGKGPVGLPAASGVRELVDRLDGVDLVVLVAPGAPDSLDGVMLSQVVDAVVLVVDARTAHRAEVTSVSEAIVDANGTLVGALLVARPGRFRRRAAWVPEPPAASPSGDLGPIGPR
ncbi:MAG: hypothetical protein U0869_01300 [Chloroflexota bacterium]